MKFSLVLLAVLPFIHAAPAGINNSPALANREVALKHRSAGQRRDVEVDVEANVNVANIVQAEAELKISLASVLAGVGSAAEVSALLDLIIAIVDNNGVVPANLGDLSILPHISADLLVVIKAQLDAALIPLDLGDIVASVITSLEGLLTIDLDVDVDANVAATVDATGAVVPVLDLLQSLDSLISGFSVGGTVAELNDQLSQITDALDAILAQINAGDLVGITADTLTALLQSIINGLFALLAGATNPLLVLGAASSTVAALGRVLSALANASGLAGVVQGALAGIVLPTAGGLLTGLLATLLSTVLGAVGALNLNIL